MTTLAYLLESAKVPRAKILTHIKAVIESFEVTPTDQKILKAATRSKLADFEDAVVEQAAIRARAEAIVARNVRDFRGSAVKAVTPRQDLRLT